MQKKDLKKVSQEVVCVQDDDPQLLLVWYRFLRRIFGPKRSENGDCKRLHNEKYHTLYGSPIYRAIKPRRLSVPEWKKMELLSKFQQVILQERDL